MPDTPYTQRGAFYPTHLDAGCLDFKACRRCLMCVNFDRHSTKCQVCESVKPAGHNIHKCTPRQQEGVIQLEERYGRFWFDNNTPPKEVKVMETAFQPESKRIMENLAAGLPNLQAEEWTGRKDR